MSTLDEIARLSGVSRSTVSRVVNNGLRVHADTRQRVQFQPNPAARRLAGGKTYILGLVIPRSVSTIFSDPFFPILIQGVSSACSASDFSVKLWLAEPEYERRMVHQILHNSLIDGIVVASALPDDPLIEAFLEKQLPFVLVGRHPTRHPARYPARHPAASNAGAHEKISYIDLDNRRGARQIVSYLAKLGHRRIAHLAGPQTMMIGMDRLEGYQASLRKAGLPYDPSLVAESDFTEEGGFLAMQRLLPHRPEAVFAASDMIAVGALQAARAAGLRVPEDISVAGFDDLPFAAHSAPPLTSVRQPTHRVGAMAVETLIDLIEHPKTGPRQVLLPTELVIRQSCSAAPANGAEEPG